MARNNSRLSPACKFTRKHRTSRQLHIIFTSVCSTGHPHGDIRKEGRRLESESDHGQAPAGMNSGNGITTGIASPRVDETEEDTQDRAFLRTISKLVEKIEGDDPPNIVAGGVDMASRTDVSAADDDKNEEEPPTK